MNRTFAFRSALAALAALCVSSLTMADEQQTTRPVIRGSGNDVTIVYQSKLHPRLSWSAPAPPEKTAPAAAAAEGPLAEALKMKNAGASDPAVIAFLQKNEVDMPDVVDADTIRDLRKAGAGDALVSLVSRYSAIDIGETAESEGAPAPGYYNPQEEEAYAGAYPDLANMGYPFYGGGGYGSGSGGGVWWGGRFMRFGPKVTPHKNVFFRSGHPSFFPKPRPFPTRFPQRMTMSRITGGTAAHGMTGGSGGHRAH